MQRQGDLLFKVVELPKTAKKVENKSAILMHGEATGHVHMIAEPDLEHVEMWSDDDGVYLFSKKYDIKIEHGILGRDGRVVVREDDPDMPHAPLVLETLKKGEVHKMVRQREYDEDEAARERAVAD